MARTKLRGVEIAGVRVAIEVPPDCCWAWPCTEMAEAACVPAGPDIYVGVRVAEIEGLEWAPMTYAYRGGHFDVGRQGEDWVIVVHGRGAAAERLARFDADFGLGEVVMSPGLATSGRFPLDGPLLEVLLLHRIAHAGGLVAEGSVVLREGRALAFLGQDSAPQRAPHERILSAAGRAGGRAERSFSGRLVFREVAGRAVVHVLPDGSAAGGVGLSARVDAIHVVDQSASVSVRRMDRGDAIDALVQAAFAPVHDPEVAHRVPEVAARIGSLVPVVRLGVPSERRSIPFSWDGPRVAHAFNHPPGF